MSNGKARSALITVKFTYIVELDKDEMARYEDGMLDVADYCEDLMDVEVFDICYGDQYKAIDENGNIVVYD